jgi:hypothetical protein
MARQNLTIFLRRLNKCAGVASAIQSLPADQRTKRITLATVPEQALTTIEGGSL